MATRHELPDIVAIPVSRTGHDAPDILDPAWNRLGIGVRCAPDGTMYATQNFGRTADLGAGGADQDRPPPPDEPIARPETDGPSC